MAGFPLEEILRGGNFSKIVGATPCKKGGNFSLGGQILKVVDTIHWAVPGSQSPVSYALTTFLLSTMPRPCGAIDFGYGVISTIDCKTFRSVSVITVERAKHIF